MKNILNLSEASNLAIHALSYLVSLGPNVPVSVTQIAKDIGVSESHLAKVLQRLAREGVILSTRGAKGGFYWEKDLDRMSMLDLVVVMDGPLVTEGCLLGAPICTPTKCRMQKLMRSVGDLMTEELSRLKLGDLVVGSALTHNKTETDQTLNEEST
jgi:Rrf2 family protein